MHPSQSAPEKSVCCFRPEFLDFCKKVSQQVADTRAPAASVRLPGGARVEFGEERGVVGVGQRARRGARWHELDCAGAVPLAVARRVAGRPAAHEARGRRVGSWGGAGGGGLWRRWGGRRWIGRRTARAAAGRAARVRHPQTEQRTPAIWKVVLRLGQTEWWWPS